MALLSATHRRAILGHVCRILAWPDLTKPDVQAAIDATDAWIDSNASAYNTALPTTFRTTQTLERKTILFAFVALRRAGLLKVEGE